MKKFITLLILSIATIGCSKQDPETGKNDEAQHITRSAEWVIFNTEPGGEACGGKNGTVIIDVFDNNRMTLRILDDEAKECYKFSLNNVYFDSGTITVNSKRYRIEYVASLSTEEEYFRYCPDIEGHSAIYCSKYGIKSIKLN